VLIQPIVANNDNRRDVISKDGKNVHQSTTHLFHKVQVQSRRRNYRDDSSETGECSSETVNTRVVVRALGSDSISVDRVILLGILTEHWKFSPKISCRHWSMKSWSIRGLGYPLLPKLWCSNSCFLAGAKTWDAPFCDSQYDITEPRKLGGRSNEGTTNRYHLAYIVVK